MTIILEGQIAIRAAIEGNSRDIYAIYIQREKRQAFRSLIHVAQQSQIPVAFGDANTLKHYATGQSHGGIVAVVGERRYVSLSALAKETQNPFVVMLDGIEDPFNFGQIIRALYAAGVHGLVVRPRNWTSAAGIVARASAGTSELIPIATVETPLQAVTHFQQRGLLVACSCNGDDAKALHNVNLTQPLFLIIGGEKRGISKRVLRQADVLLRIPYARDFRKSLGATVASSVLAFEIARQRNML